MKFILTIYLLNGLFFIGLAQNNQVTTYYPANNIQALQNRSVESVLGGQGMGDLVVGKTPSNWSVTPSGAFSYRKQIRIPQLTKGVEPQISIVYNSQSGNGLVGYNWNIGGLSAISRVPKSIHNNDEIKSVNLNTDDRFALDGARLFSRSGNNGLDGTVYGTESESFSKVVSHGSYGNGPAWFEVELKNGTKMEYGNSPNSVDFAQDASLIQNVLTWRVNKVTDLNGNYMEYEYFWLNGQQVIKKIKYTGNANAGLLPYNELEFQYSKRTDSENKFVTKFGKKRMLSNLLDKIIIHNDGYHYKTYNFQYSLNNYSTLKKIIEEGGDNSGAQFIPLEFGYSANRGFSSNQVTNTYHGDNQEYRVGDFNGDGVSDLLRIYRSFSQKNELQFDGYQVLLNINGTFVGRSLNFIEGRILQHGPNQEIYKREGIGHFMLGDFNGDGKTDITYSSIKRTNNKDNLYLTNIIIQYSLCYDNLIGFSESHYGIPDASYKFLGRRNNFAMGDFNGDGAQDLYINLSDGHKRDFGIHHDNVYNDFLLEPAVSNSFNLLSNGNSSRRNELHKMCLKDIVHVIDMNGDGVSEIMQIMESNYDNRTLIKQFDKNYSTNYVFIDDHTTNHFGNWPNKGHILRFGDFNGDGKSDILATSDSDKINWEIRLSNGIGFENYKFLQRSIINDGEHVIVADIDADGKSDILYSSFDASITKTRIDVSLTRQIDGSNKNLTFNRYTLTGFNYRIHENQSPYLLDYDGDGGVEVMASKDVKPPLVGAFPFQIINPRVGGYGQLKRISNGYGELTSIDYESISKSKTTTDCRGLYTKGTGAVYPLMDYHKPLYVVKNTSTPDKSGMNGKDDFRIKNSYFYEGAKVNLEGKGLLGFTKVAYEQEYTGGNETTPIIYSETQYQFNLTHQFSLKKSIFSSIITNGVISGHCKSDRVFQKNLSSTENFYETTSESVIGGNIIYSNRLLFTKTADNLIGKTKRTDYNYFNNNSKIFGNPDQMVETVGSVTTDQVITTKNYTYGQFGTHIPANIIATTTSVQRNSLDPADIFMIYNFDAKGNKILEQRIDENSSVLLNRTYNYSSNNFGLANTITDNIANHTHGTRQTQYIYDDKGRFLLQKINPLGYTESWTYDPFSAGIATYDDIIVDNPLHHYTYDNLHRKSGETDTYGNTTTISRQYEPLTGIDNFEANRQLYSELKSSSLTGDEKAWFDHMGRIRKTESAGFSQNVYTVTNYFSRGMVKESYESFYGTNVTNKKSYEYDEFGRNIEIKIADKNGVLLSRVITTQPAHTFIVTPFTYNNRNITITSTNLSGKSKSETYDPTGQIFSAVDDGGTLQYAYNSFGKQTEILLNGSTISNMEYDEFGFQTLLEELNSGKTDYKYNIIGELIYQKDANQNIIDNVEYDELGRMLGKTVNGGDLFFYTYNNAGNGIGQIDVEESVSSGVWNKYHYNNDGNMVQLDENIQGKVFTTKYNYSNGRLIQEKYNKTDQSKETILDYVFTNSGYISAVENANGIGSGGDFYTCLGKNEKGLNTSFERINSDIMTRTYSKTYTPKSFSSLHQIRAYEFDNSNGNLISRKGDLPRQDESFIYDSQERLKEAQLLGNTHLVMNYDETGNITNKSDIGEYRYHPTKKNALMEVTNDFAQVRSTTQDIEYDAHHNPIRIAEGDIEWTFEYGPNHQRKKATIRNTATDAVKFRYYTINAEYEYDENDKIIYQVDYVSGGGELVGAVVYDGMSDQSTVYAIYTDFLGSIELITDEQGNVIADISYDAWGRYRDPESWEVSGDLEFQPNKPNWLWRGYTGHEHMDEFQLINMNGRLYDPIVGRMLSPDNYVQDNTLSQNYNRYSYVLNNPLKYTDPSGELTVTDIIAGAAIIGGVIMVATGVAAPIAGALISGGIGHFVNTINYQKDYGGSWNDASNAVGFTFATTITFNSNNGGNKQPINKSIAPIPTSNPTVPYGNQLASQNGGVDLPTKENGGWYTGNPEDFYFYMVSHAKTTPVEVSAFSMVDKTTGQLRYWIEPWFMNTNKFSFSKPLSFSQDGYHYNDIIEQFHTHPREFGRTFIAYGDADYSAINGIPVNAINPFGDIWQIKFLNKKSYLLPSIKDRHARFYGWKEFIPVRKR